jgi:hypothetical protein
VRVEPEPRPSRIRSLPDLDAEQEVDLRKYWRRLKTHWWLPLAGLVLGAIVGYAFFSGGGKTYEAKALVYLGNPLSTGGNPLQSLAANPRFVSSTVRSEAAIRQAAAVAHLRPPQLRGHISSGVVTGSTGGLGAAASKGPQTLVTVTVQGNHGVKTAAAANALANYVVKQVSRFPSTKIKTFHTLLAVNKVELAAVTQHIKVLNRALLRKNLDPVLQVVLTSQEDNAEQRRGSLLTQQSTVQQQLTQAEDVESPRLVGRAYAVETTARSKRNSALVGGAIGLLLGLIAALALERLPGLPARRPA